MTHPIILIPARMASTRLPGKPLADIGGRPMILHVWSRAVEADIAPVVVAVDSEGLAAVVRDAGGRAVVTDPNLPSGSDRVRDGVERIDPDRAHDLVINLQGDLPFVDPSSLRAIVHLMADPEVDVGTLAALSDRPQDRVDPNVVKLVGTMTGPERARALYFTRADAPWGDGPVLHHIGIYGWRRAMLDAFVAMAPSPLELRERLEQLRALEAGMRIEAALVESVPLSVDSPDDLKRARQAASQGRLLT